MTFSANGQGNLGILKTTVTSNGGHSVDTLASMCVDKLISVSPTAAPEIKLQAERYKSTIWQVVRGALEQAKRSERTTMVVKLREAGHHDAADLIGVL